MDHDDDRPPVINIPDFGRITLDANHMRPSLVLAMIDQYDEMLLDTDEEAGRVEAQRVLDELYRIRAMQEGK